MSIPLINNKILLFSIFICSFGYGQLIDNNTLNHENFRSIVETASRSQQVVWVEDFTGLN